MMASGVCLAMSSNDQMGCGGLDTQGRSHGVFAEQNKAALAIPNGSGAKGAVARQRRDRDAYPAGMDRMRR
jgi:hypothetical protein